MPASGNFVLAKGRAAGGAIAKKRFVKLVADTPETVVQCDAQGEKAYGVSMFTVTTDEIELGKGCTVQVEGRAVLESAVPIKEGEFVTTHATGKAMVANTGDFVLGICDEAATSAGDECGVLLTPGATISAGS